MISLTITALIPAIDHSVATQKPQSGQPAVWKLESAFPKLTFRRPVEFTYPSDGSNQIFVVEQEGRVQVFDNRPTVQTASVYLDITKKVSEEGEMGLLGLAFHPDSQRNGYFYVYYTKRNPLESVIARYQATTPGFGLQSLQLAFLMRGRLGLGGFGG